MNDWECSLSKRTKAFSDEKMHARARAGVGRRVVDAGPYGEEYGASSGGHTQG